MVELKDEWLEVEGLVRKAQAGDRAAFGALVERFHGMVSATARARQRDAHEAAELVQEVFLHAMRKIGQLREPACFGAWLQKIAVRVAINRGIRRPPLHTAEPEVFERVSEAEDTPLEGIVRRERGEIVRDAVRRLKPMDREVVVEFYLKDRSLAEIAEDFDVPLGTVKRRLHVARNRLEAMLAGGAADVRPRAIPA